MARLENAATGRAFAGPSETARRGPAARIPAPGIEVVVKADPKVHGPTHLTILPTYRCTAACAQCCFESNPHVQGRIPLPRILDYIDQAARDFPTLRLVVFSGGECFLLRDDLDAAIGPAARHGLATRCVTNGYWATSKRAAHERIAPLYDAGLTELNFSTGDDHQAFVPYERVVIGATTTAEFGIRALIVVEGRVGARFTMQDALRHPILSEFMRTSPARAGLDLLNNIWIPFRDDAEIAQPDAPLQDVRRLVPDPARPPCPSRVLPREGPGGDVPLPRDADAGTALRSELRPRHGGRAPGTGRGTAACRVRLVTVVWPGQGGSQ